MAAIAAMTDDERCIMRSRLIHLFNSMAAL
jgi:hypothetical protein